MKTILLLFTLFICFVVGQESGTCGDACTWSFASATLTISGTGAMSDYGNNDEPWKNLKSQITTIVIEDGITSIGKEAFSYSTNLKTVTIGKDVASIGENAFYACYVFASITVDSNNQNYSSDEHGVLFNKDKTSLIRYPPTSTVTTYTIPDSVTTIKDGAFSYCDKMQSISIGKNLVSMSKDTLWCTRLKSIIVDSQNPNYTNNNNDGVLFNKDKTNLLIYPPKKGDVTSYTIPESVKTIEDSAFSYTSELTSITMPDNLQTIGKDAFYESRITSVTIGAKVTSIGENAFYITDVLERITVDPNNPSYSNHNNDGVLYNKDKTILIQGPSGLQGDYKIPDTVKTIVDNSFSLCKKLTSVVIPLSVTTIQNYAFNTGSGNLNVRFEGKSGPETCGTRIFGNERDGLVITVPNNYDETSLCDYGNLNKAGIVCGSLTTDKGKYIQGNQCTCINDDKTEYTSDIKDSCKCKEADYYEKDGECLEKMLCGVLTTTPNQKAVQCECVNDGAEFTSDAKNACRCKEEDYYEKDDNCIKKLTCGAFTTTPNQKAESCSCINNKTEFTSEIKDACKCKEADYYEKDGECVEKLLCGILTTTPNQKAAQCECVNGAGIVDGSQTECKCTSSYTENANKTDCVVVCGEFTKQYGKENNKQQCECVENAEKDGADGKKCKCKSGFEGNEEKTECKASDNAFSTAVLLVLMIIFIFF